MFLGVEQCLPKYFSGILVSEDMFLEENIMVEYIGEWEKLIIKPLHGKSLCALVC